PAALIVLCLTHLPSVLFFHLFFLLLPPPPRSTLFPYTTLFRSGLANAGLANLNDVTFSGNLAVFSGGYGNLAVTNLTNVVFSGKDRKSTRLNSSHVAISYAVFCLKKKKKTKKQKQKHK